MLQGIRRGRGPDQGKDILCNVTYESIFSQETRRFLVECKHKHTVGKHDFAAASLSMALHQVDGVLFITTGKFSGTTISHANALEHSSKNQYIYQLWDGEAFSKKLESHGHLVRKYLYSTPTDATEPEYLMVNFLEEYGKFPELNSKLSAKTYPVFSDNSEVAELVVDYADVFQKTLPPITLLTGGEGNGKSTFGYFLLRLCKERELDVAEFSSSEFTRRFFNYHLRKRGDFTAFFHCCVNVDALFIDNVGMFDHLRDASFSQDKAADSFCNLIMDRRKQGKITIVAFGRDQELGHKCKSFFESLSKQTPRLDMGDVNLFHRLYSSNDIFAGEDKKNQHIEITDELPESTDEQHIYKMPDRSFQYLSEKLKAVHDSMTDLKDFVLKSSTEDEDIRRIFREIRVMNALQLAMKTFLDLLNMR